MLTYNEFIRQILATRGQFEIEPGAYYENHHILPKGLGGLPKRMRHNTKHENLIWLYPQEHFTAHKLLAKENPENYALVTAFKMMCNTTKKAMLQKNQFNSDIEVTAEDYALCRQLTQQCGVPAYVGKKISMAKKGVPLPKTNTENYGKWRMGRKVYINTETGAKLFLAQDDAIPAGFILQTEITANKRKEKAMLKENNKHRAKTPEEKEYLSKKVLQKKLRWFTNGEQELRCSEGQCPPGFFPGRSTKIKQKIKQNRKIVTKCFGEKNGMFNRHHSEESKQKIAQFGKGRHWYNNTITEVFTYTCPVGFVPGRIKRKKVQ